MAKDTRHKLEWIECKPGVEWEIPEGWQVVTIVLPVQEQKGSMLVLLKGTEK